MAEDWKSVVIFPSRGFQIPCRVGKILKWEFGSDVSMANQSSNLGKNIALGCRGEAQALSANLCDADKR
jgi:hypothetical protein